MDIRPEIAEIALKIATRALRETLGQDLEGQDPHCLVETQKPKIAQALGVSELELSKLNAFLAFEADPPGIDRTG